MRFRGSRELDKECVGMFSMKMEGKSAAYPRAEYTLGAGAGAGSRVGTICNGTVRSRKSSRPADYTRPQGDQQARDCSHSSHRALRASVNRAA
jgi:hypothetical protein